MVANVGEVQATFSADNVQFLRAARQNVEALRRQRVGFEQVAGAARTFVTAFTPVGRLLTNVRVATVASAAAITVLTRNYVRASRQASELGAELIENSRRTGLQVEQLQALGAAFESEGASSEDFIRGYRRFQRAIQDASDGLSTQVRAFNRLGIEVTSYNFSLATTYEQLLLVSQGLQGLSTTAQSATLQQLGLGPSLQAALQQGPEAFTAEYTRQLQLLPPLTEEQARNLKDLNQAFTDLGNVIRNRINRLLANLAPILTRILNGLTAFITAIASVTAAVARPVVAVTTEPFRVIGRWVDRGIYVFDLIASILPDLKVDTAPLDQSARDLSRAAKALEGIGQRPIDEQIPLIRDFTKAIEDFLEVDRRLGGPGMSELVREFRDEWGFDGSPDEFEGQYPEVRRAILLIRESNRAYGTLIDVINRVTGEVGNFGEGLQEAFDRPIIELTNTLNQRDLEEQLRTAPNAFERSQIRYNFQFESDREALRTLRRQARELAEIFDRLFGTGLLSVDQEQRLGLELLSLQAIYASMEETFSKNSVVLKRKLQQDEEFASEQFRIAAKITEAQDAVNNALLSGLEQSVIRRNRAEDAQALVNATTINEQVKAELRPYIRNFNREREAINKEIASATTELQNAVGEEAVLIAQGKLDDLGLALKDLNEREASTLTLITGNLKKAISIENELSAGREDLTDATNKLSGANRNYANSIRGFNLEGFIRNNSDYVQGLREQNEEIGQSVIGLAGLRAERSAEAFIQQETRRLNTQLTSSYQALAQAKRSGDAESIANATAQLELAKQQNAEFIKMVGLLNELIAKNKQQAEEQARVGINLSQLEDVAQGLGRAFGDFTGNVLRNFNDIGDAARRLGQQILDSLINSLIVNPASDFFTKIIGSALGIPQRQNGGFTNRGLTLVGEAGPEIVDFRNPGRVYSNASLANALSGANGGGDVIFAPVINSSDPAAVNRALAEAYPIFESRVIAKITTNSRRSSATRTALRSGG